MSKPTIRDHPDFPFRPEVSERLRVAEASFLDRPAPGDPDRTLVSEFVALVHRYAFLEKLIQGEIRFELPVHPAAIQADDVDDDAAGASPEETAERRALEELGVFEFSDSPATEIWTQLDDMGIKLIGAAAHQPGASLVSAAFQYEGEFGPAFLVGTPDEHPASPFLVAHLLGHLVLDINPYRSRFCRWHASSLENVSDSVEERRADRFARAFLMPRILIQGTLEQAGEAPTDGTPDPRWDLFSTLFEVPRAVVRRRFQELALPVLGAEPPLPAAEAPPTKDRDGLDPGADASPKGKRLAAPRRLVNLALAAYIERLMERDLLAQFLQVTEDEAQEMIEWAGIPRRTVTRTREDDL